MTKQRSIDHHPTCGGPCGGILSAVIVSKPPDTPPGEVAAALAGYLGEVCGCGPAYVHAVAVGGHPPGQPPTADTVAAHRAHLAHLVDQAAAREAGNTRPADPPAVPSAP